MLQVLLTAIALVFYMYQLNLIDKIDFTEPVLAIQERLSELKVSTLNVTRLLFLQLPLWTTFYWKEKMFVAQNWGLRVIQAVVTISFTALSMWLFFHIKPENQDKKWFR